MVACSGGHTAVVTVLLSANADVNTQDKVARYSLGTVSIFPTPKRITLAVWV
jgi:energy-converting hydrogenase Eha subunit A